LIKAPEREVEIFRFLLFKVFWLFLSTAAKKIPEKAFCTPPPPPEKKILDKALVTNVSNRKGEVECSHVPLEMR
jgi:hypothetical protein